MAFSAPMAGAAPAIEMLPNPDFSFPRIPQGGSHNGPSHSRALSMGVPRRPRTSDSPHKRAGSVALPNFAFNSADTSGLSSEQPEEPMQTSPSRNMHKRQTTSELVGGKGVEEAINSSPTKTGALQIPESPTRKHRSGHSRSRITMTGEDWSEAITKAETQPRLSNSLPSTPMEHPTVSASGSPESSDHPFGPPLEDVQARPPSRPRVEFSDNVEYIPRPLSTISSETGSSMSTVRGHSVNNSISSVLSLGTSSPPSSRMRAMSLEPTLEDEPRNMAKSSPEKRVEREGQWLKSNPMLEELDRQISEPSSTGTATEEKTEPSIKIQLPAHKRKQSLSHALGFDRRRSEPSMGVHSGEPSRLSALSLQEPSSRGTPDLASSERRSSGRKLKDWAVSKLSRKPRPHSVYLATPSQPSLGSASPVSEPATAETDLNAAFTSLDEGSTPSGGVRAQEVVELPPSFLNNSSSQLDEGSAMLDLDAALGPFKTPSLGHRPRRELHSSRGTKDFAGPGLHYVPNPNHRRTESAPLLTHFEQSRTGTPPQTAMGSVFEEDEEEEAAESKPQDEESCGVQIVDSDMTASASEPGVSFDDGLRIQSEDWEPERPSTSYGNFGSRLSTPIMDRRSSSVIEDTIMEETGPTELSIVEAHEEPRAQSLTKSSDSSETPTILAGAEAESLPVPSGQKSLTTPESYQTSAFSSPDFARRQGSFDTSRLGTSASSIADNRTVSSCTTGEPVPEVRISTDDVPSLTSSRSTMFSTMHANSSRRDMAEARTPSVTSGMLDPSMASERRRKRGSIQSLSQLMGGSFGPRPGTAAEHSRPQTATDTGKGEKKKEHRLKKLMFWKSKTRQASTSTVL